MRATLCRPARAGADLTSALCAAFVFEPSELSFEAGTLVRLSMTNPSKAEHYFSALAFSSKVYSVLVEVNGVEVKGPVGELSLPPGASLEWTFIPIRSGE